MGGWGSTVGGAKVCVAWYCNALYFNMCTPKPTCLQRHKDLSVQVASGTQVLRAEETRQL